MTSGIDDLPEEVLEYVLGLLHPYQDLENCKCVSRRWYNLVQNVLSQTSLQLNRGIAEYRMCWDTHSPRSLVADKEGKIAARSSHSAVVHGNSMFIFGGGTFEATNFNDLWRFDLSSRRWVRPLSMGNYPPPKSCATFCSYANKLILFGGWRYNSNARPIHDVVLYSQLHVYDVEANKWTLMGGGETDLVPDGTNEPPPLARHSATIAGDEMIVFGGIQKYAVVMQNSNAVWRLNLNTFKWQKQETTTPAPVARYGQAQVQLDERNILICGGCGGPNSVFRDAWLLTRPAEGRNGPWVWKQVVVKTSLKSSPSPAGHIWLNPVCVSGDKLLVLGPTRANDFQMVKETNGVPAVNPDDRQQQQRAAPQFAADDADEVMRQAAIEARERVQRLQREMNHRAEEARLRMQRIEEENILMRIRNRRRIPIGPANVVAAAGVRNGLQLPRRVADHRQMRLAAFQDDNGQNNNGIDNGIDARIREVLERNDARQMVEERGAEQHHRRIAQALVERGIAPVQRPPLRNLRMNRTKLLALHVCDLSAVLDEQPVITWQDPPANLGCFPGAPERLILYSLVVGKGELIMFGGMVRETTNEEYAAPKVSNSLHFLSVPKRII